MTYNSCKILLGKMCKLCQKYSLYFFIQISDDDGDDEFVEPIIFHPALQGIQKLSSVKKCIFLLLFWFSYNLV